MLLVLWWLCYFLICGVCFFGLSVFLCEYIFLSVVDLDFDCWFWECMEIGGMGREGLEFVGMGYELDGWEWRSWDVYIVIGDYFEVVGCGFLFFVCGGDFVMCVFGEVLLYYDVVFEGFVVE